MPYRAYLIPLLFSLLISACGQTGKLYLPAEPPAAPEHKAATDSGRHDNSPSQ